MKGQIVPYTSSGVPRCPRSGKTYYNTTLLQGISDHTYNVIHHDSVETVNLNIFYGMKGQVVPYTSSGVPRYPCSGKTYYNTTLLQGISDHSYNVTTPVETVNHNIFYGIKGQVAPYVSSGVPRYPCSGKTYYNTTLLQSISDLPYNVTPVETVNHNIFYG
uniref:Uncharacterized protein n=1 Tax=Branchiostoma floridae TaxID=7739 RepID=C3YN05_BRAFL|eukprot:XP_002602312.1 hypothetical protein BRAFLDRAFT_94326 [Branchiostoma floridae]